MTGLHLAGPAEFDVLVAAPPSREIKRAVDVFADLHDRNRTPTSGWYRDRIPRVLPGAGEQFSFEVDLDACTGCKACVVACHNLNGLDDGELWREVGLLHSVVPGVAEQRTVTTACHHCVEPACLAGCPVNAYEKQPITGIVVHLDDQCIGCSYCTMMCPYEVPTYNERLGIVRKCDMCHGRLAVGESPACVQGCPNAAIRIAITATSRASYDDVSGAGSEHARNDTLPDRLVPGAPRSSISVPTTRYLSAVVGRPNDQRADELVEADHPLVQPGRQTFQQLDSTPRVAAAHMPLVAMLLLMQAAAGVALADHSGRAAWLATVLGAAGGLSSVTHLGRPRYAWRVVLGVRTSWLSREALAISLFIPSCALHALLRTRWSWALAALSGALVTIASVRVYSATHRAMWSGVRTGFRFAMVAVTAALATLVVDRQPSGPWPPVVLLAAAALTSAVVSASRIPRYLRSDVAALRKSAVLLALPLVHWHRLEIAGGFVAAGLLAWSSWRANPWVLGVALGALGASFVAQRVLFFASVAPDRMPR